MEDITAVIIIGLSFAFWAFIVSSNIFNSFRAWLATAIIVFALAVVAVGFEITALGGLLIFALGLLSIIIGIAKHK